MPLDTADVLAHIKHELGGGDLSVELDKIQLLNEAGHYLYSMHPWRWAQSRAALLDLRGLVSGSTATWTAATKTLTQASAFATYSFLSGDEIQISSGTGATTGTYEIASKTDSSNIVLVTSLSAVNLTTGNIVWRIEPQTIALPVDLRDIVWISTTNLSGIGGVALTSFQEILEKRGSSVSVDAASGLYYGAVVFTGTPPVPILEIYPTPNANSTGALRIFYRSRWAEVTGDSDQIQIPEWVENLYIWIARAFAGGTERGNVATIHQRLGEVRASPIFEAAVRSDGMVQPYHGFLRGGGPTIWRRYGPAMLQIDREIAAPSI